MADKETILVVDDDEVALRSVMRLVEEFGYQVEGARTGDEALAKIQSNRPSAMLLDVLLPGIDGLEVLRRMRARGDQVPAVMLSAFDQVRHVVEAMRLGAFDYLRKPVGREEVHGALTGLLARRKTGADGPLWRAPERLLEPSHTGDGYWNGEKMTRVRALIDQVADTDATVLIRGESGVGKELVARALHHRSSRRARPWVKVNCAALPTELLESELFGYERGAFTGAHRRKPGRFEFAQGGTIFLDEIGELAPSLQAKLLQVLQDSEFMLLGGDRNVRVDVRVVASTHRDLERALAAGDFREDLYYRLNVVSIWVPPLRERREEIPGLVANFLTKYSKPDKPLTALSPNIMELFQRHNWPGNVRELENIVRRIIILATEEWVAAALNGPGSPPEVAVPAAADGNLKEIAKRAAREAERAAIKQTLDEVRWNRVKAARRLGISYKTMLYKIKACGLAPANKG